MKVQVVHIEEPWNMNRRRAWREQARWKKLREGECILAINSRRTIAQYITRTLGPDGKVWLGVAYEYPPDGQSFDLPTIVEMIARGFYTDIDASLFEDAEVIEIAPVRRKKRAA